MILVLPVDPLLVYRVISRYYKARMPNVVFFNVCLFLFVFFLPAKLLMSNLTLLSQLKHHIIPDVPSIVLHIFVFFFFYFPTPANT